MGKSSIIEGAFAYSGFGLLSFIEQGITIYLCVQERTCSRGKKGHSWERSNDRNMLTVAEGGSLHHSIGSPHVLGEKKPQGGY